MVVLPPFHPLWARVHLSFRYSRFRRVVTCVRNPARQLRLSHRLTEYISRLLEAGYGRYGLCVADGVYVSKKQVSPLPWGMSLFLFPRLAVCPDYSGYGRLFPCKGRVPRHDGKYRLPSLFTHDSLRQPSRFAQQKRVFHKLSREIPCLTCTLTGTLFSMAKKKSIPKRYGHKKSSTQGNRTKEISPPSGKEHFFCFKFH